LELQGYGLLGGDKMNMEELLDYLAGEIDDSERLQKIAEKNGNSENACYYIGWRSACSQMDTKIKTP